MASHDKDKFSVCDGKYTKVISMLTMVKEVLQKINSDGWRRKIYKDF